MSVPSNRDSFSLTNSRCRGGEYGYLVFSQCDPHFYSRVAHWHFLLLEAELNLGVLRSFEDRYAAHTALEGCISLLWPHSPTSLLPSLFSQYECAKFAGSDARQEVVVAQVWNTSTRVYVSTSPRLPHSPCLPMSKIPRPLTLTLSHPPPTLSHAPQKRTRIQGSKHWRQRSLRRER